MKVCITSSGPNLDDTVDPRFGRCRYFIILDIESMRFEAFDNAAIGASGGAGIQSAQFVGDKGAIAVLTGNVGPNAYNTLQAAGLKIFTGISGISVRQAVEEFKSGKYKEIDSPSVQSKSGMGGTGGGMGGGMGQGRGMGQGIGRGQGVGNINQQQSSSPLSKAEELTALREEFQSMKQGMEIIQKRIDDLTEDN